MSGDALASGISRKLWLEKFYRDQDLGRIALHRLRVFQATAVAGLIPVGVSAYLGPAALTAVVLVAYGVLAFIGSFWVGQAERQRKELK